MSKRSRIASLPSLFKPKHKKARFYSKNEDDNITIKNVIQQSIDDPIMKIIPIPEPIQPLIMVNLGLVKPIPNIRYILVPDYQAKSLMSLSKPSDALTESSMTSSIEMEQSKPVNIEPVEPIQFFEPVEPVEPIQFFEPVEPVEPIQFFEPVEPIEPVSKTNKKNQAFKNYRSFYPDFLRCTLDHTIYREPRYKFVIPIPKPNPYIPTKLDFINSPVLDYNLMDFGWFS